MEPVLVRAEFSKPTVWFREWIKSYPWISTSRVVPPDLNLCSQPLFSSKRKFKKRRWRTERMFGAPYNEIERIRGKRNG